MMSHTTATALVALLLLATCAAAQSYSWATANELNERRALAVPVVLNDGRVLVVGGSLSTRNEIYDPSTGQWTYAGGEMQHPRLYSSADLLFDGKVLIFGGLDPSNDDAALNSTDLYDPVTDTIVPLEDFPSDPRGYHRTLVITNTGSDATVIVAGGYSNDAGDFSDTWTYSYPSGGWQPAPLNLPAALDSFAFVSVNDSSIFLVAGGYQDDSDAVANTYMLALNAGFEWQNVGSLAVARWYHDAQTLQSGLVLVVGGFPANGQPDVKTVELFSFDTLTWTATGDLNSAHVASFRTSILLPGDFIFIAGDRYQESANVTEVWDPATGAWTVVASAPSELYEHVAVAINENVVLVVGSSFGSSGDASEYRQTAALFTVTPPPTDAPTDAPTSGPTDAPTSGPTDAPTSGPTDAPTSGPTDAPTSGPTDAPTSGPTDAPTSGPTDAPTTGPTTGPTSGPTTGPTNTPTPTSDGVVPGPKSAFGLIAVVAATMAALTLA